MENLMEYRMLPAISTFPQFNRPVSILSPLDLSLRTSSVPITPPTTPSPPRKRTKLFEEHAIWQPHSMSYFDRTPPFFGVEQRYVENHNSVFPPASASVSPKVKSDEGAKEKPQNADKGFDGQTINLFDSDTIVLTEDEKDTATESNDEEYVDVLGNDDDESSSADKLFHPNSADDEDEIDSPRALTREKLVYEDEELHQKAMDGFAKLFMRDFKTDVSLTQSVLERENTQVQEQEVKTSKAEKKRFKMRKQISLDEDNTSPVSGTIIRKLRDDEELVVRKGDIDPAFNVVEITEEAKAILATIDNKIGEYLCQLCRTLYDDAFQLAQHRCPRIVHIEYKCTECEKVFNCPANLASHRRWHKPKNEALGAAQLKKRPSQESEAGKSTDSEESAGEGIFNCRQCGKSFRRQAYLKKHLTSHQMLDDLKTMDSFKQTATTFSHASSNYPFAQVNSQLHPTQCHLLQAAKNYPNPPPGAVRFPNIFTNFDHRRFHVLSDLYLSHQLDRSSAFQYVQNQNLRGLSMTAPIIPPLMQMPVK